ncbi:MAG: hypothetical protein AAGA27_03105 [Pseudomonadota bacterium]
MYKFKVGTAAIVGTLFLGGCASQHFPWEHNTSSSSQTKTSAVATQPSLQSSTTVEHYQGATPVSHQSLTAGKIANGMYTAPIGTASGNDHFSVKVPSPQNIAKQDVQTSDATTVTFGPSTDTQITYRLDVTKLPQNGKSFKVNSATILQGIVGKMQSPTELYSNYQVMHGHSTREAIYSQNVNNKKVTEAVYIVKQRDYAATFWFTDGNPNDKNTMAIKMGVWKPFKDFMSSFKLIDASTATATTVTKTTTTSAPPPPPPPVVAKPSKTPVSTSTSQTPAPVTNNNNNQ